ncbi:MAG: hypothetical protein IPH85_04410 [Ignavibacteria bacterium]|nr:hypothetical protein [Ignavibacteria bacterium]
MDLINDSSFVALVETSHGVRGLGSECLDIRADVAYAAPPPIPLVAHAMGPFRQSMIPTGEQLLNDFTAFTDVEVEDEVEFVVLNSVGAKIRTVPGKQIKPGVWRASIDMASCMPPTAQVYVQSYDRGVQKRRSQNLAFTIRANRPAWISRGSDVRWSNIYRDGNIVRVNAHINLGPVYRQALTKRVPLLGGLSMMVLPMAYNARLEWNTSTNRLRAIKDSSSVKIWYTTASEFIDSVNNWVGDGSNALTVFGALLEASKNAGNDEPNIEDPVIDGTQLDPVTVSPTEPSDPAIPNLNWNLADTESSSFTVDDNGDLDIHSTFLESGIVQMFPGGKGIQATVNIVIGEAEDDVEEFTAGTVDLNVPLYFRGI